MKPSLVFFGTGPVSRQCLEGIYDAFEIEAIITKPDRQRPDGQLHEHPVREWAEELGVTVHQVAGAAELERLFARAQFTSRMGLVVDFGVIIPQSVIDRFPLGIINSHFSLLPLLRGADPITFAILEGHQQTGVSLMRIVAELDAGPLLAQQTHPLQPDVTTPELTRELGDLSNNLLRRYLPQYAAGKLKLHPQPTDVTPTYTRRLTKADGEIDWQRPATELERQVRALIGWPGSHTKLYDREVIIAATRGVGAAEAQSPDLNATTPPGTPIRLWPDRLLVATGDGWLEILQLKPAGKREMTAADFLRGVRR